MNFLGPILGVTGVAGLGLYLAFVPGAVEKVMAFLAGVVRIVKENPWQVAVALSLAWGTYERLDAAHAYDGWRKSDKRYDDHIAEDKRIAKEEVAGSTARAKENNNVHTVLKVVYRDAIDRYIAASPCIVRGGSSVSAPTPGSSPGVPETPPAVPEYVAVPTTDFRAFGDVYAYAYAAYLHAKAKVDAGKAVYASEDLLVIPEPALTSSAPGGPGARPGEVTPP